MTSLYLIRHAQAQGNVEERFQGQIDLPLTPAGKQQCGQLALRMRGIPLDAVYTSPLQRATDTAAAVAATRYSTPVTVDGLVEIDGGAFENRLFSDLRKDYSEEFRVFLEEPHNFTGVDGGESLQAVYDRIGKAVADLVERHRGGVIAAVSHGAAIRCYLCRMLGYPLSRLMDVDWSPNTGVTHIIFDSTLRPVIQYIGDDSHLRGRILRVGEKIK